MKTSTRNPEFSGAPPALDVAALDAKLDRMLAVLERIAVAVEGNHPPQRRVSGVLLAAIHGRVADCVFVAVELLEFAEASDAEELRDAILAEVGSLNPRRLGKRFAAIEGDEHDGYRLRRVGSDRDGICWQVVRVSESANPPSPVSSR